MTDDFSEYDTLPYSKWLEVYNLLIRLTTENTQTQSFCVRLALQILSITAALESGKKITDFRGQSTENFRKIVEDFLSNLGEDPVGDDIKKEIRKELTDLKVDEHIISKILDENKD